MQLERWGYHLLGWGRRVVITTPFRKECQVECEAWVFPAGCVFPESHALALVLGSSLSIFFFSVPSSRVSTAFLELLTEKLQDPCFILWLMCQWKVNSLPCDKNLKKASSETNWWQETSRVLFQACNRLRSLSKPNQRILSWEKHLWKRRKRKGKGGIQEEEEDTKEKQGEVTRKKTRRKRNK